MLRVAGGELRGRKLQVPPGARPTLDKVRQAIFNILQPLPEGGEVLDGFAGSGALGIEALSRGFARGTFVEHAPGALVALRRNLGDLGLGPRATVIARPWAEALGGLRERQLRFELVLLDPPYAEDPRPLAAACFEAGLVAQPGVLVIEAAARGPRLDATGALQVTTRRYGDTALWILRRPA